MDGSLACAASSRVTSRPYIRFLSIEEGIFERWKRSRKVKETGGLRHLSSKRSHGDGDLLGLLLFAPCCNRSVVSECTIAQLACRRQGSRYGTTHPVEVESMSRPNQGHPTFSVLLHANDIPRRTRVPLNDWQDLAVATVTVFHQLVVLGPVAYA